MIVSEAIAIQREFIANKYHIFRASNKQLKESMRVLTKAYDELWEYLEQEHQEILDEYLMREDKKIWKKNGEI